MDANLLWKTLMRIWLGILSFLAVISSSASAASLQREYNTWYSDGVVLYGMTQTSNELPVMVSISQRGHPGANMVVSYIAEGGCDTPEKPFDVSGHEVPATYKCVNIGHNQKIEHFAVTDAERVNGMVQNLKSDFTLVLQNDIKVWAANIKTPKFGVAPNFL